VNREGMTRRRDIVGRLIVFAICIGSPILVGAAGSLVTRSAVEAWYPTIEKPWFTPPGWLFGPVWTVLYILMGVAAYLVWRKGWARSTVRVGLRWFLIQLVLNALWSPAFFGLRSPVAGLIIIVPLVLAILRTLLVFRRVSAVAAWLLSPYLAWTTFATVLNISIVVLNW